ncbi:hypothetical protein [Acetobacter malorum]|nr:hypothetical protein [Acetobacter malorum]
MKHLMLLRLGKKSIHKSWIYRLRKIMDIAFIYYDDSNFSEDSPDYEAFFEGTKLTGIKKFLDTNPNILENYDYFWLFEDDLVISHETADGIISFINKYRPVLSAPSLTADSFYTHPVMFQNIDLMLRGTDFVECMSPIMSREFLRDTLKEFEAYPIWGIEYYWQHLLWEKRELAFIYDKYPISHTRPTGHGSLYKNAEGKNINHIEDNAIAQELYGKKFNKYINVLFGMQDNFNPSILVSDDLREYIDSGSRHLVKLHGDHIIPCLKNDTYFANSLFTQFLSFQRIQEIFGLHDITPLESQLIVRTWSFGRIEPHAEWAKKLKFDISGNIRGYNNSNERYWKVIDDNLVILGDDKMTSTVFNHISQDNGKFYLQGEHKKSSNMIHYLKET